MIDILEFLNDRVPGSLINKDGEYAYFDMGVLEIKPELRKYVEPDDIFLLTSLRHAAAVVLARAIRLRRDDANPPAVPGSLSVHDTRATDLSIDQRLDSDRARAFGSPQQTDDVMS